MGGFQKQPLEVFYIKKGALKNFENFPGKYLCHSLCAKVCRFIKKETQLQVSSCEFSKSSKNTFLMEHFWGTAS